jgi:hypothetical protein
MKILNKTLLAATLFTSSFLSANAVITNNVPSAISSNKTFKLRGKKMNSKSNPFKVTIAAYNADGTTGEILDITKNSEIRKKSEDDSYMAKIMVPNVAVDLKVELSVSGGNVPESDPQRFVALLLSDPSSDSVVELDNDGTTLGNNVIEGPAGDNGLNGNPGPKGDKGDKGDKGEPGALAIDGGSVDVDPLFNLLSVGPFPLPFDLESREAKRLATVTKRRASVEKYSINLKGASYFKVVDSDTSTTDILGNISGAVTPGHKLTILFAADALVTNNEDNSINAINLAEESRIKSPFLTNKKALSLTPGTYFELFEAGSTLELVYDGNSWFELHRSSTKDPVYSKL